MTRTLAVVHNNIDGRSAIGAIAEWAVRAGLERGWQVTAVCRDLEPALRSEVRHRPLYVPPRLHLLQWAMARPTIRRALGDERPDAMLVYQPQVAAIADVWHVEFLSRESRRARGPLRGDVRARVADAQAAGVALLEDRYLQRLPSSTRVLFCSEILRDQFTALYGAHANSGVLHNPALLQAVAAGERVVELSRRAQVTRGHVGQIVGFLGGGDPRKGGDLLVEAIAREPELFLLHAGPSRLDAHVLGGRAHNLGHLSDVTQLLDVVDVLAVPSRFEPFGLVVAEAAARGAPVIVAPSVGAAPLVVECGAGAVWQPGSPLGPVVAELIARRAEIAAGGRKLVARLDPNALADQLFADLDAAAERNARARR